MMTTPPKKLNTKFLLLVMLLSAVFNFSFLEYNNYLIRKNNPNNIERNGKSLVYGQTVFSVDNEYYLSPVDNFLNGKGWKRSPGVSNGDYFRRVPGYSLVYLFFTKLFGYATGHLLIKLFQFLLFISTIPAIYYLAELVADKLATRLITIIYAFIPFISSWTFYTLTESISPALMSFYVFFLYKAYRCENSKSKLRNYIVASVIFSVGVLTRPYIAIAGLALLTFTFKDFFTKRSQMWFRHLAVIWLVPVFLIGIWTARNYLITEEFVPLEKAVHPQTLDRMKPEFKSFLSFTKCWGEDGSFLNTYHIPFYFSALKGDTSSILIENILNSWPQSVVSEFGHDRLFGTLKKYQTLIFHSKPYVDSIKAMPNYFSSEELTVAKEFNQLVKEYRAKHIIGYWIKTPLIYLKRMVLHSNTANIFFFQEENRTKTYVNIYRYFLIIIHIFLYFSLFSNLILLKGVERRLIFVYIPLLFVIFFTVIHREIEQRYMLPVLPVLMVGASFTLVKLTAFIQRLKKIYFF